MRGERRASGDARTETGCKRAELPLAWQAMASEEEWEFYYCRVDDAPASIFLNLAYRDERPEDSDALYSAGLQMLAPGEHGMGEEPDVGDLWKLEDAIVEAATAAGFTYVGRLRNNGDWQLTFYAAPDKEEELEQLVVDQLSESERGYRIGSQEDDAWKYYEEFLFPDAERWQWIMNRRVVQQLSEAGDTADVPRDVDHFIHFGDAAKRDAFLAAAQKIGFRGEGGEEENSELPYSAHLVREDPVELDHIHDVVMELVELADEHGGEYDGWGAPVATREPS